MVDDFRMRPERWGAQWESWLAEQRERIERRYPTLGQIEHFYVPHCNHLDGNPEPPQSTERGAKHDT